MSRHCAQLRIQLFWFRPCGTFLFHRRFVDVALGVGGILTPAVCMRLCVVGVVLFFCSHQRVWLNTDQLCQITISQTTAHVISRWSHSRSFCPLLPVHTIQPFMIFIASAVCSTYELMNNGRMPSLSSNKKRPPIIGVLSGKASFITA